MGCRTALTKRLWWALVQWKISQIRLENTENGCWTSTSLSAGWECLCERKGWKTVCFARKQHESLLEFRQQLCRGRKSLASVWTSRSLNLPLAADPLNPPPNPPNPPPWEERMLAHMRKRKQFAFLTWLNDWLEAAETREFTVTECFGLCLNQILGYLPAFEAFRVGWEDETLEIAIIKKRNQERV